MDTRQGSATSEAELHRPQNMEAFDIDTDPQNVSELKPADRGRDAWMFLVSGFVIEALVWGKFIVPACTW